MPQTRNRTRSGAPAQEQASTESAEQKPAEEAAKPVAKEEPVDEPEEKMENDKGEEANGEENNEEMPEEAEAKETKEIVNNEESEEKKDTNETEDKPAELKEEPVNDHNSEEPEPEAEAAANDEDNKASGEETKEKKEKPQIELDEKAKTYVVVVVGYVTYADFGLTELKLPLLKCVSFETRFFQDEDTKKGYVTMYFTKSWDAYVAVDKLRGLEVPRGGSESTSNYNCWLLDKKTAHNLMHQETTTLRQLRTQLNSTNEQDPSLRSLFVANIPKSATKELLTAIFAEAQDIVLPLAEPGKNKGYCYIEFNDAEKLDEYLTKYQDIKIEDGEVSAKIIIRKLGNSIVEKGKDRANRLLKARSKQQISDLGKKNSSESKKKVRRGPSNYRGGSFNRNERYNRQYRARQYGGGGGGGGGGGYGGGGGFGRGGGRDSERRGNKRRLPSGPFDDFGDYGMAKARRYDGPMGMMGMEGPSSHFYEDNYEGWGSNSFAQGYGGGGGGYMGGGGGGGGGYGGGGGGMGDGRRRKNFRKFKRN